jgi:polysaccharide transporter, PST family
VRPFDSSGAFRPVPEGGGNLRHLAVQGAGMSVLSGVLEVVVQVIAAVVLARLLTPADFGVVAMVTTFSLLLSNFGFNGFTEAVLQREEIDHFLASNLFWINTCAGLLLAVGFAAAGPLVARFYSEPRVTAVAAGISVTVFVFSSSVLHQALLKRAMRFSAVAVNDVISRILSVAVSILLAWAGWGYWALVAGVVLQTLSVFLGALILCRWVPSLPRRVPGTLSMVKFALRVYGRFGVNYGARNMDNVLVGWRFSAHSLGFYKRAYDLFAMTGWLLVSSLTSVAVSALSRLNRESKQYKQALLSALEVMAFVGMGVGAALTLVGKDVIRLLLGPRWEESGRIFTYFGPGIGVMLLYGTHSWLHLSSGRPDRWLRWALVEFAVTGLLFGIALPWGPVGIAVAWSVSFWILMIPALRYAGKPIGLNVGAMLAVIWKYMVASLVAGCASFIAGRALPGFVGLSAAWGALARIVTISLLFLMLYLAVVVQMHRGLDPLYRVARLVRDMVASRRLSTAVGVVPPTDARESDLVSTTAGINA